MNIRKTLLSAFLASYLAVPSAVRAADGGRLRLATSDPTPAVGQVITVDVLVEGAPSIYGADVRLAFDPAVLEVVDTDDAIAGIQLRPGPFLDAGKSFILQQTADNEKGIVDYALALLNPAPAVDGNGVLVQVDFRAKAEGRTEIVVAEGKYGTRTGETIEPSSDRIEIRVTALGGVDLPPAAGPLPQVLPDNQLAQYSGVLAVVLAVVGLAGGLGCAAMLVCWFRRKRAKPKR
jgi:hypothetical protein